MTDISDIALYGSRRWVAKALGMSLSTFDKKRPVLEQEGFPSKDPIVGLYLKADVEAWVSRRRQVADRLAASQQHDSEASINVQHL